MRKSSTQIVIAVALIGGALGAIYGRAIDSPFLFDDSSGIVKNSAITRLWPLIGDAEHPGPWNPPANLPTSGRPLVSWSLALNYHFGQLNPVGYHVFNLVLHLLSALLLLAIVRRTLRLEYFEGRFAHISGALALAVALLWAVHPLQTEAVVYITQRTELMVGFFYLATLYASLRYWQAQSATARAAWTVAAGAACLAGMASKEVMATAPVVVLLFERTFIRGSFRQALQKSWPLYAGLALGWGLLFYLNLDAPRSGAAGFHRGLPAYVWWLTQAKVLLMYLKLAVWPWPLSIHYGTPYLETVGAAWPWLATALLLGLGTLLLLWRHNAVGFVGAWVLLILSPTLLVPIVTEVAAERRMYLPLAALTTLFVAGTYGLAQQAARSPRLGADRPGLSPPQNMIAAIAVLALALVLSLVSYRRLAAYHDALTLWQDSLASQPDDPFIHNNLGASLLSAGRLPEAIESIQQALRVKPDFAEAHYNLGFALSEAAKLPRANATDQNPAAAKTDDLAADAGMPQPQARLQDIIGHYLLALRAKPDFPEAEFNLAVALDQAGKRPEAIEHFRQAIRLKPNFPEAYNSLGASLMAGGQPLEAIEPLEHALRLNPNLTEAHNNLGIALVQTGRIQQGIEHFQQAVRLSPKYAEVHLNLGLALNKAGRWVDGIEQFKETLQLDPHSLDAYANMARAYAVLGRPEEAIAAAEKALELARMSAQSGPASQIDNWLRQYRLQKSESNDPSPQTPPAAQPSP